MNNPIPGYVAIKNPALVIASVATLLACGAGRSQLVAHADQPTGGSLVGTGGGFPPTGGTVGKTGGAVGSGGMVTGGYPQVTGGRPSTGGLGMPTGGIVTGGAGAGGRVPATGGLFPYTGGFVANTGGFTSRSGGLIIGTGGLVIGTGGLVVRTGGWVLGTGGVIPRTGGIVVPPDAGTRDTAPLCGSGCEIYCPYGYRLDSFGCSLCSCNPPPDASLSDTVGDTSSCPDSMGCKGLVCPYGMLTDPQGCPTCRCNVGPDGCPAVTCKPCPFGLVKDAKGCFTCECVPDPAIPCNQFTYSSGCNASTRNCKWLTPGCDTPALTSSGCFDSTQLDCDGTCPSELTCLKRSVHPCPGGSCGACGSYRAVCL